MTVEPETMARTTMAVSAVMVGGDLVTSLTGREFGYGDLGVLQTRPCKWCRVRTPHDRCHNCGGPR